MEPAVKPAIQKSRGQKVLVFATSLTLREAKFRNLVERVDDGHRIDAIALPGLVRFAEMCDFDKEKIYAYLDYETRNIKLSDYGTIVLGCTHFTYFRK